MYKVLIVDDEAVERRGLKVIVDWEKYGFDICGEAIDGRDGLSKVEEYKPDVIFVDIKMPYMDGIEMMKELNNRKYKCKIIVLTGYAEFEYAQKVIEYGGRAYLLKPFDENEISRILEDLEKALIEEENKRLVFDKSVGNIRDQILSSLITGEENVTIPNYENEKKSMFLGWSKYQVMLVYMEYEDINVVMLNEYKIKINQYTTENNYGYTFIFNNQLGVLLNRTREEVSSNQEEKFRTIISTIVGSKVKLILGPQVDKLLEVCRSYKEAESIAMKKFFFDEGSIFNSQETSQRIEAEGKEFSIFEMINNVYIYITLNDQERISNEFNLFKSQMILKEYSEGRIKGTYSNVYRSIIQKFVENGELSKEVFQKDDNVICELYDEKSLESLNRNVVKRLIEISGYLFEKDPNYKIKKLVEYVKMNFDKDLKLEELCVMYNYSQSYIGKLFKNYTGEKFDIYIDKLRIEKAKELLIKGMKACDVAKKVGFNNADYFYIKFKKYVGVTPKEFKNCNC